MTDRASHLKTSKNAAGGATQSVFAKGPYLRRKCGCAQGKSECAACSTERESDLRRRALGSADSAAVPDIVNQVLDSPGRPLDSGTRAYMEPRFGRDFSDVRVHTDSRAADSARAVNALAYTVGRDVVFGDGHYTPATREGRSLLAHELTHVSQNATISSHTPGPISIGPAGDRFEAEADERAASVARGEPSSSGAITPAGKPGRLSRATFTVGPAKVQIDYANVMKATDSQAAIEAMFTSYTGSPATAIHADVDNLTLAARHWLLFALDLLVDNPVAGLDKATAVKRLIEYAPKGRFDPQADKSPTFNFANEALSVSGWFEKAVTAGLIKPKGAMLSDVQTLINPGSSSSGSSSCPSPRPVKDQLDAPKLQSDLPGQLETYLKAYNKQITSSKNPAQPMSQLLPLADPIQEQARTYYAGYADRARGGGNTFLQQWQYSAHLASVQSPAGNPDKDKRLSYLDSRAKKVGGAGLFSTVHFDARCDADANVLDGIVQAMEKRSDIQALLDPILRQKSYTEQTATPKQVVLSPESDKDECVARWKTIKTMCHELMHVMVHPDFRRAEKGRQILTEGFPEVLGHYLYQEIKKQADSNTKLKAQMEAGLNSAPCSSIPDSTIEYKEAGKGAEDIRSKVGPDRFRAAFFLGQLDMVGLQPKRIGGESSNDRHEMEADAAASGMAESRSVRAVATPAPSALGGEHLNTGPGHSLEPKVRREMETKFGHDFSRVRVHADGPAADSAASIGARAYTVGRDIVFGAGQYAPQTAAGQRLLIHELTHTIQQSGVTSTQPLRFEGPDSPAECEADSVTARLGGSSSSRPVALGTFPVVSRDTQPALRRWKIAGDTATSDNDSDTLGGLAKKAGAHFNDWKCIKPITQRTSTFPKPPGNFNSRYELYVQKGDTFDISNLTATTGPSLSIYLFSDGSEGKDAAIAKKFYPGSSSSLGADQDIETAADSGKKPIASFVVFGHASGNKMWGAASSFKPRDFDPEKDVQTFDLASAGLLPRRCWFTRSATARSVGCDSETWGQDFAAHYLRLGASIITTTRSVRPTCTRGTRTGGCTTYDGLDFATSWMAGATSLDGPFTSAAAFHGGKFWTTINGKL